MARNNHRMATQEQLDQDFHTSLYEQFCPSEPGPWIYDLETSNGTYRVGYQGSTEVAYPDRWEAEHQSFLDQQSDIDSLDSIIVGKLSRELKEKREERLSAILLWVAKASIPAIKKNKSVFWKRVLKSRQQCAKTGLWYHVYLTKSQVDCVFAAFEWRLAGNTL